MSKMQNSLVCPFYQNVSFLLAAMYATVNGTIYTFILIQRAFPND